MLRLKFIIICQVNNEGWGKGRSSSAIVVPAAKTAASKNHPKDILRNKNHHYRIVLVHLTSNDAFKTRKHLQIAGY